MSGRWFDSSRQIFWDNDQQDLTIPGALNAQSATFDSVSSLAGQVEALTTSSIVSNNLSSLTGQISSLIALNVSSIRGQVGALTTSSIVTNNLSSQTSQISSLMALNFSTVQGTINGLTTSSIVSNNLSSLTGQISSLITLNISSLRGQVGALSSLTIQTSSLTAVNISSFQGEIGQLTTSSIVSNNLSSLTSQVSSLTALNISSLRGQVGALTTSSIVSNNISSLTSQSGALTTSSIRTNSLFANGAVTLSNLPVNNVLMIASTQQILTSNSDTGVWGYYYSAPSGTNIANRIRVGSYSGTGQAFTINEAGGNVGIGDGMYNPVYTLDVVGTGNFRNLNASNLQVPILGTNSITANSYSWQTTTSNDNFNTELTSAFNQQGSNFTLECYLYPTFLGTFNTVLSVNNGSIATGGKEFRIYYNGSNGFGAGYPSGATTTGFTTGSAIALNTWYHLALVRNATNISLYLNGSNWASATMFNYTTSENRQLQVFAPRDGVQTGQGLINSIRFTIGQALYTGPFTPPTQQLTNTSVGTSGANVAASITGTVAFLGAVRNSFTYQDASPTILTITVAGKPIISVSTPTTFISNLIINGGVSMSNLPANNVLMIASTQQILLSNSANGLYSYIESQGSNGANASRIRIGSYFSNAGQALTFNESGGNVGIGQGMTNPLFTLDVNGTARIQNSNFSNLVLQTAQDSNSSYILFQKSTLAGRVGWFGQNSLGPSFSSIFGLFSPATTNIGLYAAGNTSIFCSSNGNVGVGTSNPAYKLDITGTGRFVSEGEALRVQATQNSNSLFTTFQKATVTAYVGWFGFGLQGSAYSNYFGMQGSVSTSFAFYAGTTSGASPSLFLGSNSRVGILTDTPQNTLDVNGTTRLNGAVSMPSLPENNILITSGAQQVPLSNSGSTYIYWQATTSNIRMGSYNSVGPSPGGRPFTINELGGNVGIGTTNPLLPLHVATTVSYAVPAGWQMYNSGTGGFGGITEGVSIYALGDIWSQNRMVVSSDERIKQDITPLSLDSTIQLLQKITPVSYTYKDIMKSKQVHVGFIAQAVEDICPNAVSHSTEYIPNINTIVSTVTTNSTITTYLEIDSTFLNSSIQFYTPDSTKIAGKIVSISSNSFDTLMDTSLPNYSTLLCQGTSINDFRVLDKDYIFTLNVAATKKLMELVEQQGSTIQGIQQQLSTLQRI